MHLIAREFEFFWDSTDAVSCVLGKGETLAKAYRETRESFGLGDESRFYLSHEPRKNFMVVFEIICLGNLHAFESALLSFVFISFI